MDSPFSYESIQGFAPTCAIPMFHMSSTFLSNQMGKGLQRKGKNKIKEYIFVRDKFKK